MKRKSTLRRSGWWVLIALATFTPLLHAQGVTLSVNVSTLLPILTANGTSSDVQAMTLTTSWIGRLNATVTTCVYMVAPLTGAAGNPDTIPQADIMVTVGGRQASIQGPGGCGYGTALQVNRRRVRSRQWTGSFNTTLQFQAINTGNLAADTYTGTIYIVTTAL